VVSRHQVISPGMTQALELVAFNLFVVGANELSIINEVPFQEVLELFISSIFPEVMSSVWISMISHMMSEASIDENWTLFSQEDKVVARDSVVVPFSILDLCTVSIHVELVAC